MAPTKKSREENKDYCKRYREKNQDSYRINDAERKKHKREQIKLMNPALYELKKKEERERKQLSRLRKKYGLDSAVSPTPPTPSATSTSTPTSSTSTPTSSTSTPTSSSTPDIAPPTTTFTTKQAKARSINRAEKALPQSPRKKAEILGSLAKKYQLRIVLQKKRGRKGTDLSEEEKQWIIERLDVGDLTYINPGRKDHVYIGKKDGERQYAQKRYLLWTLRDLLDILNGNEVTGAAANAERFVDRFDKLLTFSQLYAFVKSRKQYLFNRDIPQGSCLCEICENSCLLAKGINKCIKEGLTVPANPHDIVEENCCVSSAESCMLGLCKSCEFPKKFYENEGDSDSSDDETRRQINYEKWARVEKKIQKITVTEDYSDCFETWKESVANLKQHIYRKRCQASSLIKDKDELEEGDLLMQVDYSESYKNETQNEIQSAYFGHDCFSLFTACCYYRKGEKVESIPMTITSESSDHSRIAAFSCVNKIIEVMTEEITAIKRIIVWSDGMGAQFRSRFVFMLVANINHAIEIEWNYNEAHHGKGPMDGVGGTIKNMVFRAVKSGKVAVRNPSEFADMANKIVPTIRSIYMPLSDVLDEPENVVSAPPIPETLKIHKFKREFTKDGIPLIKFFKLSKDDTPYFTQYYRSADDPEVCGHVDENIDSNTCGHCRQKYKRNEMEEWLCCPICENWFHESCFHKV